MIEPRVFVFWNQEERRLRALWRILLQASLMAALGVLPVLLIAEPLTALHRRGLFLAGYNHDAYDRVINMIIGPLLVAAVVGSIAIASRWLDRRPIARLGVVIDSLWWRYLFLGFLAGCVLMTLVFLVEYNAGMVEFTGTMVRNVAGVSLGLALSFSLVKVVCVGIYEELVSRGYLLRNLSEGLGTPAAVIVSSAVFSVLHLFNDNASFGSAAGLFINGLMFAAAALLTGRLSTAIGLHISWNLFEGVVFGFPVSGDREGASLIGIHQLGADYLTGGPFGPEAGLVGVVASLLGILLVWRFRSQALRT